MFRNLLILLIVLSVAACGPASLEQDQQPLPTASADWTSITFTQSGGIMGMLLSITVQRNGSFTVTDERAQSTVTGTLKGDDLARLNEMILSLSIKNDGQSGVCADCFIYSIEIATAGKSISAQADDVNLTESGIYLLVLFMQDQISKELGE
jgi:hypothetical protein